MLGIPTTQLRSCVLVATGSTCTCRPTCTCIPKWRLETACRDYSDQTDDAWKHIKEQHTTAPPGHINWPDDTSKRIIDKRPWDPLPIHHLTFSFTRRGRKIDQSITTQIKEDMTKELLHRLSLRAKQGWIARHIDEIDNLRSGPNNVLWYINTHKAAYHTRNLQVSDTYRKATYALRYPEKDIPTSINAQDQLLRQCPLCDPAKDGHRPPGTARHLHCLCTNAELCRTRNLSYDAIEDTLRHYKRIRQNAPKPIAAITDEQSEFSQQTDSQPSMTSVPSRATAASIRSKAKRNRATLDKKKRNKSKRKAQAKHKHQKRK